MSSDYKTKLQNATFELYEKGIKRKKSHTLVFKVLRLCGFKVRLPAYSKPKDVLIYTSIYFMVVIAGLYGYVQWKANQLDVASVAMYSIIFGALAGVFMMWLTDHNQKKLNLTPWEEL